MLRSSSSLSNRWSCHRTMPQDHRQGGRPSIRCRHVACHAEHILSGKSFKCTECGKCCTGEGEIWATTAECTVIAEHLGQSMGAFKRQYTKHWHNNPGWHMLRSVRTETGSLDCIFLKDNRCSINDVKPVQCATYPWWPELVMQPEAWEWEKHDVCEGLDHEDGVPAGKAEMVQLLQAAQHLRSRVPDWAPAEEVAEAVAGQDDSHHGQL